jgi:CheY-like chemotaxis protein
LGARHEIVAAASGAAALAILERDQNFDVILCDLMMPDMSGIDLYTEIAKRSESLAERMLFMTGGAFTPEASTFLEKRGRAHVLKPFEAKELLSSIDRMLESVPDEPASLPPTTVADFGDRPTELHLRFPKEWDQLEVVRESCGFFARAAYRDILVGQRVARTGSRSRSTTAARASTSEISSVCWRSSSDPIPRKLTRRPCVAAPAPSRAARAASGSRGLRTKRRCGWPRTFSTVRCAWLLAALRNTPVLRFSANLAPIIADCSERS